MDYSERMLRAEIERLPDGTYSAEGFVDGFIDHPDPRYRDLRVAVAVTVSGSEIHVDLTGTADQIDLPLNMPFEGTVDIDLPDPALDPPRQRHPPARAGQLGPVPAHLDPRARGVAGQPALPRAHDRALLHRQRAGGHAHARDRADRPGPRQRRVGNLKVVAYSGLLPEGGGTGCTWTSRRARTGAGSARTARPRRGRHPVREHAQQPHRGHREPPSAPGHPLRAARGLGRRGPLARGIGTVREIEMLADGGFSLEGDGAEHRRRACSAARTAPGGRWC